MKLHKFIRRICAAAVAAALTLSLCTPVLAEGIAALPAAETGGIPIDPAHFPDANFLKYVEKIIDTDHSIIISVKGTMLSTWSWKPSTRWASKT